LKDRRRVELRDLPSVDAVLKTDLAATLTERFGHEATANAIRALLTEIRATWNSAHSTPPTKEQLAHRAHTDLERESRSRMRPVFNLTGTIIHTNLGRALLAEPAIEAAIQAMREAVALEFDVTAGRRGERDDHVRDLLCELTGAEHATIVNNNAAAVLLTLNTLAGGREAIVSRGELIEIGGAFRMPDIMQRAGARLIEVGTTNRTHPKDYKSALTPQSGVILKVHTSNYRILGFTTEVQTRELAAIARGANVPLLHDLGSGVLIDLTRYGLQREPTVREAVAHGADVVTFSGDKLLGGPQAGFIVGKRSVIEAINRNPMKRALRVDKIRLAAIEATLKLYRNPERLAQCLPTLQSLARTQSDIAAQARRILPAVHAAVGGGFTVDICQCQSQIGSGAMPLDTVPSAGLCIRSKGRDSELDSLAAKLRAVEKPIIGRIEDHSLILDFRCLTNESEFLAMLSSLKHGNAISTTSAPNSPTGKAP